MVDEMYVSAADVSRLLGVTRATVYSYVSRGKLRSRAVPGSKERLYWRPDVEGLLPGEVTPQAEPSVPSVETTITLLTPQGPVYRGRNAITLAEAATLEDVAAILWDMDRTSIFNPIEAAAPVVYRRLSTLLTAANEIDRATALFPLLERADPRAYDLSRPGMARTGSDVLRWLAATILQQDRPTERPLHETLALSRGLGAEQVDLIRRMLVLSADNAFEGGTIAVRAVASTGVTPWRAVLTGLSITTGRLSRSRHYGEVARFVELIINAQQPERLVIERLQDGEVLPGFTSRPYPAGDPRATALLAACQRVYERDREFHRLQQALEVVETVTGQRPSFALANNFVRRKLGLADSNAPFLVGRSCGWIAHSIEQHESGEVERRPVPYRGKLPNQQS